MNGFRGRIRIHAVPLVVLVIASLNTGCHRGPGPTLDGVDSLLATKQFDAVETKLDRYLGAHPESAEAHLLMAQVALSRDPQKPNLALEHLDRIRASDRPLRSLVKLNEGKAHSALSDHVRAEAAWLDALRADPSVPEAGWALLSLYYIEGRRQEAERLGLALHAIEPDPRDRVQLLLELVRQDAKPIIPSDIAKALEPAVQAHPEDWKATIAFALAKIRDSQSEDGLPLLSSLVDRSPGRPDFWEALLHGIDEASRPDLLSRTLDRLPQSMGRDGRFARYTGIAAQNRRDWPAAIASFEEARRFNPIDSQVVYRLGRVYRLAGRDSEAERCEAEFRASEASLREMLPLYNEANAVKGLGKTPSPDLYRRIAEARERLGHRAEALAWYRLALRDRPDDVASLEAVKRLADVKFPTLAEFLDEAGRGR